MPDQTQHLVDGTGICDPRHRMALKINREVLDLGAGQDAIRTIFAAVHRANRHSVDRDFAAIALPGARIEEPQADGEYRHATRRSLFDFGDTVEIFGSEAILSVIREDEHLQRLSKRGMFKMPRIREVLEDAGSTGIYLGRMRAQEKRTAGAKLRQAARDARRAEKIQATKGTFESRKRPRVSRDLFMTTISGLTLDLRVGTGTWDGGTVEVSTYGLCSAARPVALPSVRLHA